MRGFEGSRYEEPIKVASGLPEEKEKRDAFTTSVIQQIVHLVFKNSNEFKTSKEFPLDFFREVVSKFSLGEKINFTGAENIPDEGRLVFAFNHAFGLLDTACLVQYVLQNTGRDVWTVIGDGDFLPRLFKRLNRDISDHSILYWEKGRNANAVAVLLSAIDFLENSKDGMLFIAPEHIRAMFRSEMQRMQEGFSYIAEKSGATVLPVLITGEVVDPDNLIFDIRGEILPPLETSGVFSDGAELSGRTRTDVEMLKAVFRKVLMGRGR